MGLLAFWMPFGYLSLGMAVDVYVRKSVHGESFAMPHQELLMELRILKVEKGAWADENSKTSICCDFQYPTAEMDRNGPQQV